MWHIEKEKIDKVLPFPLPPTLHSFHELGDDRAIQKRTSQPLQSSSNLLRVHLPASCRRALSLRGHPWSSNRRPTRRKVYKLRHKGLIAVFVKVNDLWIANLQPIFSRNRVLLKESDQHRMQLIQRATRIII